jgi:hypothetical protein
MKRRFYRYELWEAYKYGMWDPKGDGKEEERIQKAVEMFIDTSLCLENMRYIAKNWYYTCIHYLSVSSANHQSWIGRMATCYYAGTCIDETNEAWKRLTDEQRAVANSIADTVFYEWKQWYESTKEFKRSVLDG